MTRSTLCRFVPLGILVGILGVGCATTSQPPATVLREAKTPAYSIHTAQDEMVVALSPARRTLQIAGSTGFAIGVSVDAVVNDRYRGAVREALADYNPGALFETNLVTALENSFPGGLKRVAPLGSTAGYANTGEAVAARYAGIARQGVDALLDLRMTYGLYGTEAEVVAELEGNLIELPSGRELWNNTYFATPGPVLANERFGNPRKQRRATESGPRFSVDEEALARLTADAGRQLRDQFEQAVHGVVAALLTDLALGESPVGHYYLGRIELDRENAEAAQAHFLRALELEPAMVDARNAMAINLAENDQLDDAIGIAKGITQQTPDYAPAWFNLAWWYAEERDDEEAARPFYLEARRLGLPPDPELEDSLGD